MVTYNSPPKIHTTEVMFIAWAENMKKEKPHLIIKNLNNNAGHRSKPVELWYEVKQELAYLENRNLEIDAEVQKLEIIDRDLKDFSATTVNIFEKKKEIMQNKMKIAELKLLSPTKKELVLDYPTFKKILLCYNTKAVDYIIKGETLNLNSRLGYLQIRKITPLKRPEKIDWGASLAYKKELLAKNIVIKTPETPEGKNWLIYSNHTYYLRWSWVKNKGACTVKNHRVFAFYATASTSNSKHSKVGTKTKLAAAQKEDSLLHTRYTPINFKAKV